MSSNLVNFMLELDGVGVTKTKAKIAAHRQKPGIGEQTVKLLREGGLLRCGGSLRELRDVFSVVEVKVVGDRNAVAGRYRKNLVLDIAEERDVRDRISTPGEEHCRVERPLPAVVAKDELAALVRGGENDDQRAVKA